MEPFVVLAPGSLDGRREGDVVALPPDTVKHLRTVLRRRPGSPVVLADGVGVSAPASLAAPDGARLTAAPTSTPAPRPSLHVLQGLPKGRKLDDVVRTLTELGVDRITPVAAERSVVELVGARLDKAVARWRAVAVAAAEQSRRPHVPVVDPPATVDDVVAELDAAGPAVVSVVAHVGAPTPLAAALPSPRDRQGRDDAARIDRLVLAVGPEGGWTTAEVERFSTSGAVAASLGASVLRTEHAAPALAAIAAFTLGRMA